MGGSWKQLDEVVSLENTKHYNTTQYHTTRHDTTPHNTTQHCTTQHTHALPTLLVAGGGTEDRWNAVDAAAHLWGEDGE